MLYKKNELKMIMSIYFGIMIILLLRIPYDWGDIGRIENFYKNKEVLEQNIFYYGLKYLSEIGIPYTYIVLGSILIQLYLYMKIIEHYMKKNKVKYTYIYLIIGLITIDYFSNYLVLRYPMSVAIFCFGIYLFDKKYYVRALIVFFLAGQIHSFLYAIIILFYFSLLIKSKVLNQFLYITILLTLFSKKILGLLAYIMLKIEILNEYGLKINYYINDYFGSFQAIKDLIFFNYVGISLVLLYISNIFFGISLFHENKEINNKIKNFLKVLFLLFLFSFSQMTLLNRVGALFQESFIYFYIFKNDIKYTVLLKLGLLFSAGFYLYRLLLILIINF